MKEGKERGGKRDGQERGGEGRGGPEGRGEDFGSITNALSGSFSLLLAFASVNLKQHMTRLVHE